MDYPVTQSEIQAAGSHRFRRAAAESCAKAAQETAKERARVGITNRGFRDSGQHR
jgi:hypothetical protein